MEMKTWESHGLKCIAKINQMGIPVGYVGLPKDHPDYCKHYDELHDVEVHGGLTFSDFWEDQDDGLWYFGFDCGHAWDLYEIDRGSGNFALNFNNYNNLDLKANLPKFRSNKDISFVIAQCELLAEQMSKRKKRT